MNPRILILLASFGLTLAGPLRAQTWDATRQASGWAYQEVDGSLMFFDPASRSLRTWMKGSGLLSSLRVTLPETRKPALTAKLRPEATPTRTASDYEAAGAILYGIPRRQRPSTPRPVAPEPAKGGEPSTECDAKPERWVVDSYSRTWMTCDGRLVVLGKDGQVEDAFALPAPVEDLAVGREGILVLYRTAKPYLEKRDLRTGTVQWSYGDRNQLREAAEQPLLVPLNRMALGTDGTIYLAEGASLALTVLDPTRGPKEPGQAFFTCQNAVPGRATLGWKGRGPLLSWAGREVLFGVFVPSQVKACGAPPAEGLMLGRFDLAKGSLEWLPTNLSEGHRLVGLLDTEAVFLAPGGGLAYAPIR